MCYCDDYLLSDSLFEREREKERKKERKRERERDREKGASPFAATNLLWKHLLAESKVRQNQMTIFVQENVLKFNVTIHNAKLDDRGNNIQVHMPTNS